MSSAFTLEFNTMFTGLVETMGEATRIEADGPGVRLTVRAANVFDDCQIGASISINGCCLTVVDRQGDEATFEAGAETLQRTNLGNLVVGGRVNLESSLKLGDPLGGHLVTGHIDGVGQLESREDDSQWSTFWIEIPNSLGKQMASKGSVAVDGVSLTLVEVEKQRFSIALIPHTLQVTTLGSLAPGDPVNLETDVLAKYVQRQLEWVASP
jgi:riboflavin synthase